jgi:hypothetical protein
MSDTKPLAERLATKKRVTVRALKWTPDLGCCYPEMFTKETGCLVPWKSNVSSTACGMTKEIGTYIKTLEGDMQVQSGDWIITDVKGERYPCKPDIFAATYDLEGVATARPTLAERLAEVRANICCGGTDPMSLLLDEYAASAAADITRFEQRVAELEGQLETALARAKAAEWHNGELEQRSADSNRQNESFLHKLSEEHLKRDAEIRELNRKLAHAKAEALEEEAKHYDNYDRGLIVQRMLVAEDLRQRAREVRDGR